jgi:hypothetical protein
MKQTTHHKEINFGPFATNVLDVVDRRDLVTPTGEEVTVRVCSRGFVIDIGNTRYETKDNLQASYILNTHQVGTKG